ncbi:MAG: DNA repair protein RadA, partial [Rhizobacter sp.]|nr:DNA repair protein RadA [Chlorobiales bacterium]
MAKVKTRYVCSNCGAATLKYQGKCFECNSWGTLVEEIVAEEKPSRKNGSSLAASSGGTGLRSLPQRLPDISALKEERLTTGIGEFDRVLGGGLMAASVILIGGEPGIGKSTLMLQI